MSEVHPTETFREIPGYNGDYRAGNLGTIQSRRLRRSKSIRLDHWWTLKQSNRHGYLAVRLTLDKGTSVCKSVHHLVLEAFVGPCPDEMECRHLDGDKANNSLANLAWGTRSENLLDRTRHGQSFGAPKGSKNIFAKLTDSQVIEIRALIADGWHKKKIAAKFGIVLSAVYKIHYRESWNHIPPA